MLAFFGSVITTWMLFSLIGYLFSTNTSFREIASSNGMLMFMLVLGWIPSMIVTIDFDSYLDKR